MAELLVSVRSVEEAAQALAGGAAIIDVKEPQLGSLGKADDAIIADVLHFVAGRRPVSAALGELLEAGVPLSPLPAGLTFVKYGLANCGRVPGWQELLSLQQDHLAACQLVHVAYADWRCAQSPPLDEVVELACRTPGSVLLLDTCCKTPSSTAPDRRPTLLDWISVEETIELCRRCRQSQIRIALAGSLGMAEIMQLRVAEPTWFAVRGEVCSEGRRDGLVQECRVRNLARLLKD
jgi:(5-formylfuran-3-yl)methyl phosphate synthase